MMHFPRTFSLPGEHDSFFLFGPRMTGKTTILRSLPNDAFFDLLDPDSELQYRSNPKMFKEEMSALKEKSTIIIDEIQRVPELLNYVQMGIDRNNHQFILSGSSARKLKHGGANLLGGRALEMHLHPLTCDEMGTLFDLPSVLEFGSLPRIASLWTSDKKSLARKYLRSYLTTYIKEEIQAEALTRNIGSFQRFLDIAGQNNAQVIEYANISRDSSVAASTIKGYYQILEDTLLGFFLWPWGHSEKKKCRPKFYFFDCGVVRALQNRLQDPPTPVEKGFLFETWFINELRRMLDYGEKYLNLSFWRERNNEIDIIISKGTTILLAIECKAGTGKYDLRSVQALKKKFPDLPVCIAVADDIRPRHTPVCEIVSWKRALERARAL